MTKLPAKTAGKPVAGKAERGGAAAGKLPGVTEPRPLGVLGIARPHVPGGDDALAPVAAPKLEYKNGPLLTAVQVFTIFVGPSWGQADAKMASDINGFFQAILTSALIDQLAEYNVPGHSIGHGKFLGTAKIPDPLPATVTDSELRVTLEHLIKNGTVPKPNPNLLYFIYVSAGSKVTMGNQASCADFCGYHSHIGASVFYAVMPYPNCPGCLGSLQPFDALTSTSSHELCEAITDPIPGSGWYDTAFDREIGDECAWKVKKVGAYTVQQEWSNAQKACD